MPWWLWSYYDTKGYCIVLGEWQWVRTWMYMYRSNSLSVIMAGRIIFALARLSEHVFIYTFFNSLPSIFHTYRITQWRCSRGVCEESMLIFIAVEITFSACGHALVMVLRSWLRPTVSKTMDCIGKTHALPALTISVW